MILRQDVPLKSVRRGAIVWSFGVRMDPGIEARIIRVRPQNAEIDVAFVSDWNNSQKELFDVNIFVEMQIQK